MPQALVGTAGWSIPTADADAFAAGGSSLERYASRFGCAEINSTFHRSHRRATFARWAGSVPESFRFSAKLSKTITHKNRLQDVNDLVTRFFEETGCLGSKLAVVLVQLPPSLAFDQTLVSDFFELIKRISPVPLVCEPRHETWFGEASDRLLAHLEVARVAADPAKVPSAAEPGGWRGLSYYRLHGSPVPYRSSYGPDRLAAYAQAIRADVEAGRETWCVFDNTASSAAAGDAIKLQEMLGKA